MRNPIRTYLGWYGSNLTDIAAEPALKAIGHFGVFAAKNIGLTIAINAAIFGGIRIGTAIKNKIEEVRKY